MTWQISTPAQPNLCLLESDFHWINTKYPRSHWLLLQLCSKLDFSLVKLITYFESELELAKLPTRTAEISIPNCVSNLGIEELKVGKWRKQLQSIPRIRRTEKQRHFS